MNGIHQRHIRLLVFVHVCGVLTRVRPIRLQIHSTGQSKLEKFICHLLKQTKILLAKRDKITQLQIIHITYEQAFSGFKLKAIFGLATRKYFVYYNTLLTCR